MAKRQQTIQQLRNLPQYSDKTDEELEEIRGRMLYGSTEDRLQTVLDTFAKDYDLSDMNANDELSLRNLAQLFVRLEDIDRAMDTAVVNIDSVEIERLGRIASTLRKDASTIQHDLYITRRARKGDTEADAMSQWERMKLRAKKQLDKRLSYIYCPKCKMLLATIWTLYPESNNVLRMHCTRVLDVDSGEVCNNKFTVKSKELKELGNRNITSVLKT